MTRDFLRAIAQTTTCPYTAMAVYVELLGGPCPEDELRRFMGLAKREQFKERLHKLLSPIDGNVFARDSRGEPLRILPESQWTWPRTRHFQADYGPEFTFERGLAEARAAVDSAGPPDGSPQDRRTPPMGGRTPPLAAASIPSIEPGTEKEMINGNSQLRTAQAAAFGGNDQPSAEAIVRGLRACPINGEKADPDTWRRMLGWWVVVCRNNPERIQRAYEKAIRQHPANLPALVYTEIKNMENGL